MNNKANKQIEVRIGITDFFLRSEFSCWCWYMINKKLLLSKEQKLANYNFIHFVTYYSPYSYATLGLRDSKIKECT